MRELYESTLNSRGKVNGNMHMKGHSLLLVIREMQIKITEGFYSSRTRVAVIEKTDGNNWIGCGELEIPYTSNGAIWCSLL